MSCSLDKLVALAESEMASRLISDYCPNGLQVEGCGQVLKVVGGVTASQALIDAAIQKNADVILVHHGFFWKGEAPQITGVKRQRLKKLLANDISLLAYHLPLDVHPHLGNNVGLANALGVQFDGFIDKESSPSLVSTGLLPNPVSPEEFRSLIACKLGREPLHINVNDTDIHRIAWCTGAAQGYIKKVADSGVDAYISGEISESTVHFAREQNVHYFSAGHHATETFGVKALGAFLADKLDIEFEFLDIFNPA